jgi:hypothetical protein
MTNFTTCKPQDVLRSDFLDEYKGAMTFFHLQLSRLNIDLFIVEKILDFPSELFVAPPENIFLGQVVHNFFQVSTLQVTKVVTDQGGDTLTLPKFKNTMLQAITDPYREDFREHLRLSKFSERTRRMLEKAKRLRDTCIAHFISNPNSELSGDDRLTLGDLQSLRDELNAQLNLLSFNSEYVTLPIWYHPGVIHPVGSDWRSDIEKFLDGLALQSDIIHMPERHPEQWPYFRQTQSPKIIDIVSRYRERFGLPPA